MTAAEKVNIQLPIDKSTKKAWEKHAKGLGFDSIQAYLRFMAKADIDGRRVDFDAGVTLSRKAAERYDKTIKEQETLDQEGNTESFASSEAILEHLV